jgi:hypothetical protein
VGRWYRAIFVNLDLEARALATAFPCDAHILDIGGGDGEPLNYLLRLRPDLRITTIDPGPEVGQWIASEYASRVTCLPKTGFEDYLGSGRAHPDALLIADVVHHIPEAERVRFLGSVAALLGFWSDRYITGDRSVSLISRAQLIALFETTLGPLRHEETPLFEQDRPNYAITFFR